MDSISETETRDKLLLSRLDDLIRRAEQKYAPGFLGFLDEREAALVEDALRRRSSSEIQWLFYGGYEQAERVMLGLFPEQYPIEKGLYPFSSIVFSYRSQANITHRDVLGSMIGCGVKRDKIGDILCGDGQSVAFVAEELCPYLAQTLAQIGREGVKCHFPFEGELPVRREFRSITGTVASPRLDSVVKVLLGISREQAVRFITSSLVSVNHIQQTSVSTIVQAGDRLSVRGQGRFVVDDVSSVTKKGRLVLVARKYL